MHIFVQQAREQIDAPTLDIKHDGMMSQSVVLECQQGGRIWLEADVYNDCFLDSGNPYDYSTFSGFRVGPI